MPDNLIRGVDLGAISDLPMEDYLSDHGIAAHDCWNLHSHCPVYAWSRHPAHPHPEPPKSSEALAFGQALHTLVLEGPGIFHERYVAKPEGMAFNKKPGIEWCAAEQEGADRIILAADEATTIINIAQAIANHPLAAKSLARTEREVTLFANDPTTGLRLKNRPDAMGGMLIVNIKTAADAEPRKWKRDAIKYGYAVSQAMTARVLSALGMDIPPYVFLVVEKARNPIVQMYELSDELALYGEQIVDRSLRQWAKCSETGVWPSYREGVWRIAADKWDLDEIERMQNEGDDE